MIDAHQHLWEFDQAEYDWIDEGMVPLRRSFLSEDLERVLGDCGIRGSVAVQARCSLEENRFLLDQARRGEAILGIVGWVDLCDRELGRQLDRYQAEPLFKGVREITQGAEDEKFFTNPAFNDGVAQLAGRGLVYDVLIYEDQLRVATDFIDRHPTQSFVLDHGGKPVIREGQFSESWERGIREIARREHLVCKLSGLVTEVRDDHWNQDTLRRYVDVLLEAFGPGRLMFGSDWPVCLLASEYGIWHRCARQLLSGLSESEQDCIFNTTARTTYSL